MIYYIIKINIHETALYKCIEMIKIEALKFKYNKHQQKHVINIPLWEINKKDNILLSGKSGSGKSTLINLISGLLEPTSGKILVNDININELSNKKRNKFRADNIGLISQNFNLIPYLSVLDNINLAHSFRSERSENLLKDVKYLMNELKLDPKLLRRSINELSIGQQQRVAIIRALVNKPQILLADEPTSALDYESKMSFIKTLQEMTQTHKITLLFISHDRSIMPHFHTSQDMEAINVD